jgi:hypothetical protein
VGDLVDEPGVDEAVALDEPVLLLALAGRAIAVVLAGRRLADPAGDAKPADVVRASAAGASRRPSLALRVHGDDLRAVRRHSQALAAHLVRAIGVPPMAST